MIMEGMRLILTCLITLLATFGDTKKFRCDYTYYKDIQGWMKLHLVPETWREARLRCHLEATNNNIFYSKYFIYPTKRCSKCAQEYRCPANIIFCGCKSVGLSKLDELKYIKVKSIVQGANLASPLNANFGVIMLTMMTQTNQVTRGIFTGIHSTFSKGDYHSIENIPLSKMPHRWATHEPDNWQNNEECIMMLPSGEIADQSCSETYPYICYKKDKNEVVNSCGTIDNEYSLDTKTGSCYKFHRVPRTWSRAFKACSAEGGYLAIINSDVEKKVIASIFAKNGHSTMLGRFWKDVAFMGLHDWGEHGEFLTIEGQTLDEAGYSKFSGGEPNNSTTGEYCGSVYRNGMYNDLWCENSYAAICEMTPNSLCDDKMKDD